MTNRFIKSVSSVWRTKRDDVLALGGIIFFFIVFFSWTLFSGKQVLAGDSLFYDYPLRTIAWRMIRSGQLPLWTPHLFSGYPLLSMAQVGIGYPLTWGHLFLPGYVAEKIYIFAPFLLAPTFTYFYLRTIKRSPLGSLLGALTFGYGGMMASPIANAGLFTNAVMWLPLMLLVLEKARRGRFVTCLLSATAVYALSVLTGQAQTFLTVGLLSGVYSLWLVFFVTPRESQNLLDRLRPALVCAGAGLLAIGIAAFQILESSRVVPLSVRSELTYQLFTQGSYTLDTLWKSFTLPVFFVMDMHAAIAPLAAALALVALIAHIQARIVERDLRVFFWSIVAVFALALMMGQNTRLYLLAYYIPVLNLFRVPSRHTLEWTFAAGVLAAYGFDAITPLVRKWRESTERSNLTTIYASLALLLIALMVGLHWWTIGQTLRKDAAGWPYASTIYQFWKGIFALLLLAALWRAGLIASQLWRPVILGIVILATCFVEPSLLIRRWWTHLARPVNRFVTPTETTRYLQQFSPTENRVYSRVELMSEQDTNDPRFDAPNLSGMWGLHEVAGYEPLMFERYSRAFGGAWLDGVHTFDRGPADESLLSDRSHVLDLLNTTFLVSYANLALSLPEAGTSKTKASEFWKPAHEAHETVIWRNSRAMPRAWLVSEAESVTSEVALRRIRGETTETFDPRRTALLEVPKEKLPQLPGGAISTESSARITSYQPNRLTIETNAPTNTVLVVSELFFPGWEVTVDGNSQEILIANYLLRGVSLPAGQHKIEMHYAAPAARTGAIISLSTLALLIGLAFASRRASFSRVEVSVRNAVLTPVENLTAAARTSFARARRSILSAPLWVKEVLIFAGFLGLTAIMTWPWVLHLRDGVSDTGDPYMLAWTLWWDYFQTFHDPLRLFHANIFYPYQYTLAFSENDYGVAVLCFPLFALGVRPLTVHNIAMFSGFALCGYGSFRLTRTLTNSTPAAWIAGIVFAFIPFRLQLMSHLHYLFAGWLPLTLEALVVFLRKRSWKRASWFGFAFFMNGLTCLTWMIYALIPLTLTAIVLIVRHQLQRDRDLWRRGLIALASASLLLTPFLWPYYKASSLYGLKWDISLVTQFSAGVSDWLSAHPRNQLWNGFGFGLPDVSNYLFPGLLAVVLSMAAVILVEPAESQSPSTRSIERSSWIRWLDMLILVAFLIGVLAIGLRNSEYRFFRGQTADRAWMVLTIAIILRLSISYPQFMKRGTNQNLIDWLRSPRRADSYWVGMVWVVVGFLTAAGTALFFNRVLLDFLFPYRSLRIPGRAAMICYLGLAILSGLGATRLAALLSARRRAVKPWITYAVIIVAVLYELNAAPLALVHGAVDPDALTLTLKQTPMRGGLVELPTVSFDFPLHYAMLRAADHRRPLINAASTFISPYSRRVDELTNGPEIPLEFLDFLEKVPASYVAVRHRYIPPDRKKVFDDFLSAARNTGRLRLAGTYDNGDELYVVTKTEPEAAR